MGADQLFSSSALALAGVMARVAGWRPEEYWAATPADVRAALAGWIDEETEAPPDRAALAALMEAFPDG